MASDILLCVIVVVWMRLVLVTILGALNAWSERRRGPVPSNADFTEVTFLIPAYNEAALLKGAVQSIAPDLRRGASLIVVDDGSRDETAAIAEALISEFPRAELIRQGDNRGKPAALNAGIARVRTPYVITLDADTRMLPGANDVALLTLQEHGIGCAVAYDVAIAPSKSLFAELQRLEYDCSLNFERRAQGVLGAISVCPGAASLWTVADLRRIGGFRGITVTEDVDATLRLASQGLMALHAPGARAHTLEPKTLRQLIAQRRRWCLGHYQSMWINRPRSGAPMRYTFLTYLNFAALSLFLPLMLIATALVVVFEPEMILRQSLWFTNVIWLASAFTQRLIALAAVRQPARLGHFLLEPFTTAILHFAAATSVAIYAIGLAAGSKKDIWAGRAR